MTTTEPEVGPESEASATTAGEEDHENIDTFRGEEADSPADVGRPSS